MTADPWAERLRALYRGNSFLSPSVYGELADHLDQQTARIDELTEMLGHATDHLMAQGWTDVADRMDRWAVNGYVGTWSDAQYDKAATTR